MCVKVSAMIKLPRPPTRLKELENVMCFAPPRVFEAKFPIFEFLCAAIFEDLQANRFCLKADRSY